MKKKEMPKDPQFEAQLQDKLKKLDERKAEESKPPEKPKKVEIEINELVNEGKYSLISNLCNDAIKNRARMVQFIEAIDGKIKFNIQY